MRGDWRVDDLPALHRAGGPQRRRRRPRHAVDGAGQRAQHPGPVAAGNTRRGSRRNIHAHYDSATISSRCSSTRRWRTHRRCSVAGGDARAGPVAQVRAHRHQAGDRRLRPRARDRMRVGRFAMHVARTRGCSVTGITIRRSSSRWRRERVARCRSGRPHRPPDVRLPRRGRPYSADRVDRDARSGGPRTLAAFFGSATRCSRPAARLGSGHHRARSPVRAVRADRRLDPEVHLPRQLLRLDRRAHRGDEAAAPRLTIRAVEDIAPHYAETLERGGVPPSSSGSTRCAPGLRRRFVRMWDFYLASCKAYFRTRHIGDLQMMLGRAGDGAHAQ